MSDYTEVAKRILKPHREVSPTCAMTFTEKAIIQAISDAVEKETKDLQACLDHDTKEHDALLKIIEALRGELHKSVERELSLDGTIYNCSDALWLKVSKLKADLATAQVMMDENLEALTKLKKVKPHHSQKGNSNEAKD